MEARLNIDLLKTAWAGSNGSSSSSGSLSCILLIRRVAMHVTFASHLDLFMAPSLALSRPPSLSLPLLLINRCT